MSYRVLRKEASKPEEQVKESPILKKSIVEEPVETPVETETSEVKETEPEPVEPRRQLVPEFIPIADMQIRYVQPEPVPDFILFLQQLRHKDVNFVKIPIGPKVDKLYLHKPIMQLLGLTGVHWDKIENLIKRYNDSETNYDEKNRVRKALLAIVNLTIFITDEENIEFLRETD
jgi:hypothetical protein